MRLRILRPACSALLLFLLLQGSFAAVRTWDGTGGDNNASTPANWVGDTAPVANDDIVLDNTTNKNMTWDLNITIASWTQVGYDGTASVATVYYASGFTNLNITGDCIISNGVFGQVSNPNVAYPSNRLSVCVGGNLAVGPDGAVSVIGAGYINRKGPGGGSYCGSYGGRGGSVYAASDVYKVTHGSVIAPTNLGSAGGGTGGGAIRLTVAGQTCVEGTIAADGASVSYYSGAGGSVWLTSGTLVGSGLISANGGLISGGNGRGGGGRIALIVTDPGADFSGYSGDVTAYGGHKSGVAGGEGTVYLEREADDPGNGELIIDNNQYTPYGTWGTAHACLGDQETVTYEFSRITLTNNGVLIVSSNNTLIVTNTVINGDPSSDEDGILLDGGTLVTPTAFAYTNFYIRVADGATAAVFSPATSLTVETNAGLYIGQPHVLNCDVMLKAGAYMTHWFNNSNEIYKMNLTIKGDLSVQTGACIDVTAKGYAYQKGPGASNRGGSHGGRGADLSAPAEGQPYGSIIAPTNFGSGGGGNPRYGGGAVILNVTGITSNDGVIIANGDPGPGEVSQYNNGAGGSIYITTGTLIGNGPIRANGGENSGKYGAGGGGRISLVVTNTGGDFSSYNGWITAAQSDSAYVWGGAGTVYMRTAAQGPTEGTLIIDNDGYSGYSTDINTNVYDTVVGNVTIRNGGYLLLETNETISVSGVWSNSGSFGNRAGGKVIFEGGVTSTSTVYGSNVFVGLVCTNDGKTLEFQAGSTNLVDADGMFWMKGANTTNLFLRSTVPGQSWMLNVDASVDQSVMFVDVKDSDAMEGTGAEVIALNSEDSGSNTNWSFVSASAGETNTWTGNSSTTWGLSDNWNLGRPPTDTDFILIPSSRPRYPLLDASRTVNGIEIQSNASLSLNGWNFTITTNATIAGAITSSATETLRFEADADFIGGAFVKDHSTVSLAGGSGQSINLANLDFYKINVLNSAATVSFTDGFSCYEFRCEAPAGTRNLEFQQGSTVVVDNVVLLGSTATTNISLRSSSGGQKWFLKSTGFQNVTGVDVQDSDASPGQTITPTSSKDSGGNVNWDFGIVWANWQGTNTVYFDDAGNWSPPAVPGSSSRVLVDNANPMVITSAVSLLDLTVGGTSASVSVTADAGVTVGEDIVVLTNSTLTLNRPCVVSNSVLIMGGGTMTHSSNTTEEINKIDLTVMGDMSVDVNGLVHAIGRGYALRQGPGLSVGGGGGSYGGRGDYSFATTLGPCYGSIVSPTNMGSGGNSGAGGGAVLINVGGETRVDGTISVIGQYRSTYAGAGGTIRLETGTLVGFGTITASGGGTFGSQGSAGAGRIALILTEHGADFSGFAGSVTAYGGDFGWFGAGGPGTIYRQVGGCPTGLGDVLVDANNMIKERNADMPPALWYETNEVDRVTFVVTNGAILRLTNDFAVGDIYLESTNAILDLGNRTLHVHSFEHDLDPGVVTNYGQIIWYASPDGTIFIGW